tara:strand:+ start:442 stop:813 length:372 start_codon:yes stop_codon:yes gene_type:complete
MAKSRARNQKVSRRRVQTRRNSQSKSRGKNQSKNRNARRTKRARRRSSRGGGEDNEIKGVPASVVQGAQQGRIGNPNFDYLQQGRDAIKSFCRQELMNNGVDRECNDDELRAYYKNLEQFVPK